MAVMPCIGVARTAGLQLKAMCEQSGEKGPVRVWFRTHVKNGSRANTPPVFAVYVLGLVCRWIRDRMGGLEGMARHNAAKAKLLA